MAGHHVEQWEEDRLILANQVQNLLVTIRSNERFEAKARFLGTSNVQEHPLLRSLEAFQRNIMVPSTVRCLSEEAIFQPFCDVWMCEDMNDTVIGMGMMSLSSIIDQRCSFITEKGLGKVLSLAKRSIACAGDEHSYEVLQDRRMQICVSCADHPRAHAVPEGLFVEAVQRAFMIAVHPRTSLLLRRTTEAAMKKIVTSVYKAVVECNSNKSKCKYDSLGNYENGREPSQEYVPTGVPMLRYMCCLITGAFSEKSGPLSKGSNNSDLVTASARSAAVQLVGLWLVQAMLFVVKDHLLQPGLRQLLHSVQHDLCRALLVAGVSTDNAIVLSQILPTVHIVVKTASTRLLPQTFSFLKALHLDPLIRIANDLRVACSSGGQGQVLRSSVFPLPTIRSTSASQMSLSKILELCERREIILGSLLVFSTDVNFAIFCYTQYDLSRCFLPLLEHICEVLVENCFSMAEDHVGEGRAGGVRDGFASDPDVTCSLRRADALALEIIRGLLWQTSLNVTKSPSASTTSLLPLIESLVERKNQLMEFVSLFRSDAAKHGIPFLLQNALRVPAGSLKNRKNGSASSVPPLVLEDPAGGREVGACLQRLSRLLDKRALGEYLGELGREPAAPDAGDPNYATMLAEWEDERSRDHLRPGTERFFKELLYGFLEEFDFRGKSLLSCIRETSYCMCMPGEAQKIDRVMEAFSAVWMRANQDAGSDVNPFCSEKGPFILSFSLIMLNTDQHSGKLTTPMTQEDFRRMLRGSDGGNDFPDEFLNLLFDDVKAHPIIMAEMIDVGFTNDVTWALEMQMSLHDAADTLETMSRFSMQLSSMGTEVDGYAETLQPFVFRAIWRHCLTAFANALEAHVKLADLAFPVAYVTNGSNANDATDAPRLSDPIYVCNTALAGFCLIAKTSARHGVVNAVDHVILALLSQLPLDAKRSQGLVQRFGHYPFSALCLRGIFDLLRECTQDVMDAWEELGHLLSELFLLGMFTRDTQAGSEEGAIWSELHVRPRSSSFGTKRASSESGWLSALWGSSNPDSAREQEEEEQRITTHIKAFLPSMEELLCIIDSISSAGHRMVFRSLCNEVKAAISSGSCSAASCLMILITELAVRRCTEEDILERYGRLCQHVASHFFKVLEELSNSNSSGSSNITNTGGSSNIQGLDISQVELSHQTSRRVFRGWTPATMRLVRAMMRAVSRFLRNAESRDASSYVLRTLMTATPSVFGAFVAAELTSGTLELLSWPQLFPEVLNSSLLSTVLESLTLAFTTCYKPPVQQNAQKALSIIVKRGLYDALASSEDIVNALVVCALKLSEIDTGDTVAGSSVSNPTPLTKSLEASMTDATLETFPGILTHVCHRLAAVYNTHADESNSLKWRQAWVSSLRGFSALVIMSRQYRDRCSALSEMQCCLLSPENGVLSADTVASLYEEVLFPFTDRLCTSLNGSPVQSSEPLGTERGSEAGFSSADVSTKPVTQSLVTSLFNSLVSAPRSQKAVKGHSVAHLERPERFQHHLVIDLRCRLVSLLSKVFLYYVKTLRDKPDVLRELWQRVLGTFSALYAVAPVGRRENNNSSGGVSVEHDSQEDFVALQEAIQESVKNMIFVLAAVLNESESAVLSQHASSIWEHTRSSLHAFNIEESSLAVVVSLISAQDKECIQASEV
ncbi:hypothetical protein TRVL_01049 [Trypanosoma vivax]|nr:hypothetical protein TRVL_01049 [Trypanosoma vivax]